VERGFGRGSAAYQGKCRLRGRRSVNEYTLIKTLRGVKRGLERERAGRLAGKASLFDMEKKKSWLKRERKFF